MKTKCRNGLNCRWLTLPGGCMFGHTNAEIKKGRYKRKRIKGKKENPKKIQKKNRVKKSNNISAITYLDTNIVTNDSNISQSVFIKNSWLTGHKGCDECNHNGCSKCYYRYKGNTECITKSTHTFKEYSCRNCGFTRNSLDNYCSKCFL